MDRDRALGDRCGEARADGGEPLAITVAVPGIDEMERARPVLREDHIGIVAESDADLRADAALRQARHQRRAVRQQLAARRMLGAQLHRRRLPPLQPSGGDSLVFDGRLHR